MDDIDAPLDFESDDPLLSNPVVANARKRKKIIGLDDLLSKFFDGKNSHGESKKLAKFQYPKSDEDDNTRKKEKLLCKFVDECQKQVNDLTAEDDIPLWGQQVFGKQKASPPIDSTRATNCKLLQSFIKSKPSSSLDLEIEKGEKFLEGLLTNGWLTRLVILCGSMEDCVACWTFYQMLYSIDDQVQESACDFWCSILLREVEDSMPPVQVEWYPSYMDLRDALRIYGYSIGSDEASSPSVIAEDSQICGPPPNIRCWLKLVAALCRMRNVHPIFSTLEVEELFVIVIWLFLDRQLQGLSLLLYECLQSIIDFFTDEEWPVSSKKITTAIANRVPEDLNCLRVVECITAVNTRSKSLRSELSHQILMHCFDKCGLGILESLKLLMSINVKDKGCNFLKVYIYLVLAENWILTGDSLQGHAVPDLWSRYLRNLSSQITSMDWRSYASKVRNRASYLLQNAHTWQDSKMFNNHTS